tara:strand:+ start:171 stop:404 length:234 start_codon:yes stop_codon:yes gene_type:complete
MSWKVWTGKKQEEIRHLRGLVDEIMVICEDIKEYGELTFDPTWVDKGTMRHLAKLILDTIEETQKEYEDAKVDEVTA